MIIKLDNTEYINVFRLPCPDDVIAYFLRSSYGTALIINDKLTRDEQSLSISIVKKNIKKCGITNMGLIRKDWKYICGGPCCTSQ